jgi:hypothetical protein
MDSGLPFEASRGFGWTATMVMRDAAMPGIRATRSSTSSTTAEGVWGSWF